MPPPLQYGDTQELRLDSPDNQVESTHIEALDAALHREWALGRNIILAWVPCKSGIDVLVIPSYCLSEFISTNHLDANAEQSESVIKSVIADNGCGGRG